MSFNNALPLPDSTHASSSTAFVEPPASYYISLSCTVTDIAAVATYAVQPHVPLLLMATLTAVKLQYWQQRPCVK
jgi:hypothetical protein